MIRTGEPGSVASGCAPQGVAFKSSALRSWKVSGGTRGTVGSRVRHDAMSGAGVRIPDLPRENGFASDLRAYGIRMLKATSSSWTGSCPAVVISAVMTATE